jgi:hypothetical protein
MHKIMLVLCGAAMLGTGVAQAQSGVLTADVPFSFIVSGKTMPAGEYQISNQNEVIFLANRDTRRKVITMAGIRKTNTGGENKLVFHCAAGQCALAEFWTQNSPYAYSKSPQETRRPLRKAGEEPVSVAVVKMK